MKSFHESEGIDWFSGKDEIQIHINLGRKPMIMKTNKRKTNISFIRVEKRTSDW